MAGNSCEWCADRYGDYPAGDAVDPNGPEIGWNRVLRGGAWIGLSRDCGSASRLKWPPDYRACRIGFRAALDF